MGKPDFSEGQAESRGMFQGNQGQFFQFLPWKDRSPIFTRLDPNSPSFYVKCPRICQKTYNLDIFQHFPKFTPLPFLNFGVNPKFYHIPQRVYY